MSQKLTPNQYKALYLLADGYAVSTVAKRVGVRRETVSRWRQMEHFQSEYNNYIAVLDEELLRDRVILRGSLLDRLNTIVCRDADLSTYDLMKILDRFMPLPHDAETKR